MKRKEMKQLLEERIERISLLETRIDTMEQLVDGYRAREQSIIDTLHTAKETAARTAEEEKARANAMLSDAKRYANDALADAQAQATAMLEDAERRAKETLASAQSERERLLQSAEETKREYEQMVVTFNAILEQNAIEAEQSASRYAEFIKERKIASTKISPDESEQYPRTGASTLPDPKGDPARLMQNIYQLEKRPIPDDVLKKQDAQDNVATKQEPVKNEYEPANGPTDPLPRHARISDPPIEETNPRDYLYAFGTDYAETDTAKQTGESDPENSDPDSRDEEPAPFSQNAWGDETHRSPSEPQAEFSAAFDTDYPETDFTLMPDPACTVADTNATNATRAQEEPQPYSEDMWNHAGESTAEPQAEFSQAFSAASDAQPDSGFNAEETAEFATNFEADYEANFEAAVNAAENEPREWQPDQDESPSVAELMPESDDASDDGISLDDLLDEIIKAGE